MESLRIPCLVLLPKVPLTAISIAVCSFVDSSAVPAYPSVYT